MTNLRTKLLRIATEDPTLWPLVIPLLRRKQAVRPSRDPNPKVVDRYEANLRDIKTFMRGIEAALKVHEREFKASGMWNWGFVGDLGHVRELLEDTHKFITGTED